MASSGVVVTCGRNLETVDSSLLSQNSRARCGPTELAPSQILVSASCY